MSICQKGEIKERAIGEIITGIKRELTEEEEEDEEEETERIQMRKITLDKEKKEDSNHLQQKRNKRNHEKDQGNITGRERGKSGAKWRL